jgi:ATP synthase protein I
MGDTDGKDEFRPVDEDRRLSSIDKRLERLEASEAARTGRDRPGADPNARMANRVLADLIGGIAGGALMGWLADRLFGTWPWGFMILMFLGIIVAFRNIFRIANGAAQAAKSEGDER